MFEQLYKYDRAHFEKCFKCIFLKKMAFKMV